jgi:hypothetical protein
MSLPLVNGPMCFFIVILVFLVLGFQRGWRRELVSLVFVLLASVLIRADTSDGVGNFLGRIPVVLALMVGANTPETSSTPQTSDATPLLAGPMWSLLIFGGVVVLGYIIGDRVFGKPATPQERFIGVIPGVISGAFVLGYLSNYVQSVSGSPNLTLDLSTTSPANYVPVIFVIAILALVIALIAARIKKAAGKK